MSAGLKRDSRAFFRALGAHITHLREKNELKQADLARSIGVSQQAVFSYELGDRKPSALILKRMAKTFATTVDDLLSFKQPRGVSNERAPPKLLHDATRLGALPKPQQILVTKLIMCFERANHKAKSAR